MLICSTIDSISLLSQNTFIIQLNIYKKELVNIWDRVSKFGLTTGGGGGVGDSNNRLIVLENNRHCFPLLFLKFNGGGDLPFTGGGGGVTWPNFRLVGGGGHPHPHPPTRGNPVGCTTFDIWLDHLLYFMPVIFCI